MLWYSFSVDVFTLTVFACVVFADPVSPFCPFVELSAPGSPFCPLVELSAPVSPLSPVLEKLTTSSALVVLGAVPSGFEKFNCKKAPPEPPE